MRDLISSKRYLLLRADEIDCNRGQQRKALAPGPGIPRQPCPQELGTVGHKATGEHTGTNTPELRTRWGMVGEEMLRRASHAELIWTSGLVNTRFLFL
jgi:hypothetical protein